MEIIARGEYSVKRLPVNGKDAYSFVLSKESATVSYNADGNALNGELGLTGKARTEVCVLRGNTPLTLADPNRAPTNLLLKSNVPATGNGYPFKYYKWGKDPIDGGTYTLVYNGRYNGVNTGCLAVYSNGGMQSISSLRNPIDTTKKVTFKFINNAGWWVNFYNMPKGNNGVCTINWAAMYEGDTAPDEWEPHPSDPVARKGEFKILSATVISGTASVSVLNNVIYTNSLTSDTAVVRININAEGVDMYRDFTLQKLSVKQQVEASMQVLKESINLEIRKIEVGNRNYALLTSKKVFSDQLCNIQNWIIKLYDISPSFTTGETTISFNAKINLSSIKPTSRLLVQGSSQLGYVAFGSLPLDIATDGKFTFTATINQLTPGGYLYLRCDDVIGTIEISEFLLVKGNKVCNWQLAEEEKVNKDNIISKINLSEEGILLDGKKVEITGELLAQIIKAYSLNVNDRTIIDALGNFKTVNATISGIINALSGTIGNFSIVNGDIIGLDTTKKERIRISTNPLPSLDSLTTGYALLDKIHAYTADGRLIADRVSESYYQGADSRTIRFTLDGATSLKITGGYFISDTDISSYGRIDVRSPKITIRSLIGTSLNLENVPLDTPIPVNYVGVVELKCTTEYYVHCRQGERTVADEIYENINLSEVGIYKLGTTEKTYIGSDGFYSVFGSGEYIYFKRGVGFVTKGKTDTGGVLASGSVAANGTQTNVWGAKSSNGDVMKASVGVFNVPHRVGNTNYTVTATSHHGGISMSIVSRSAYSVQLAAVANGSEYSVGFDYTIIGQN